MNIEQFAIKTTTLEFISFVIFDTKTLILFLFNIQNPP